LDLLAGLRRHVCSKPASWSLVRVWRKLPAASLQRLEPSNLRAFLLTAANPIPDRALTISRAKLFGRLGELALVQERWQMTQRGNGQTVMVIGEAGIGKSRLVREFLRGVADTPCAVVSLICTPQGSTAPLNSVIEALRAWLVKTAAAGKRPEEQFENIASAAGVVPRSRFQ
jgi:hypothetical protein